MTMTSDPANERCEHGIWMDVMCERCQRVPVSAEVLHEGLTGPVVKALLWDGTTDAYERITDWANKYRSIDDYVVSLSPEPGALNVRQKDGWARAVAPCWIVRSDDDSFSVQSAERPVLDIGEKELVVNCQFCDWVRTTSRGPGAIAAVLSHLASEHVAP